MTWTSLLPGGPTGPRGAFRGASCALALALCVAVAAGCKRTQPAGGSGAQPAVEAGNSAPAEQAAAGATTTPAATPPPGPETQPTNPPAPSGEASVARLGAVAFRSGLERCMTDAKLSHKAVMVFFHAPEAVGTNEMKTKCFGDPEVVRLSAQLIAVDVNTATAPEIAKQYGGAVVPSIVFLSPDGAQLGAMQGYAKAEWVASQMQSAIEKVRASSPEGTPPTGGE